MTSKNEIEVLRDVTERLEASAIAYMLTGSTRTSNFGT
jgi:hypothetical protein